MVLATLGWCSCYYIDPTSRTCWDGYPKKGGEVVVDHTEEWLVCFPDGGNIRCENYDDLITSADEGAQIIGRNLCRLDGGDPCAGGPDPLPREDVKQCH
jgi:hypothetical protein